MWFSIVMWLLSMITKYNLGPQGLTMSDEDWIIGGNISVLWKDGGEKKELSMNRIVISGVCRGLLDGEQKNQGRLNPTIALADSEVVPVLNRRVRTGTGASSPCCTAGTGLEKVSMPSWTSRYKSWGEYLITLKSKSGENFLSATMLKK